MVVEMIIAFVLAFLITIGFGKFYVPWLKRHKYSQPLKDEVSQIYTEEDNCTNKEKDL